MASTGKKIVTLVAAAIADPNQISIMVPKALFVNTNALPQIWLTDLDTTKKAYLWRYINGAWCEVFDASGSQEEFSVTRFTYNCPGPGEYGFTKDASAVVIPVILES